MNVIPDLIPLHDNRPGLRSLLQVEVRDAALSPTGESSAPATLDFIASTATLDRYHEAIEPAGWQLDSYRRNPVFQNAHNYGDILFTLGKALTTEVRAVGERQALCQRIEFATEVNPVARIAYGLYKGGFLNAVSVGFIPLRWEDAPQSSSSSFSSSSSPGLGPLGEEPLAIGDCRLAIPSTINSQPSTSARPRRRYLEQELLEVSAVAIPANPDALALGLKSGAIAKSDLQATLDLLRTLCAADPRSADCQSAVSPTGSRQASPQLSTINHQLLLALARELRRFMRKA